MKNRILLFITALFFTGSTFAQQVNNSGWLSFGVRNTSSIFSDDGFGTGSGGQFRIQLSNTVSTDWFADYIMVTADENVRSEFYHIGWSVVYYPFHQMNYPASQFQPFVLAGHCFDYNKKTVLQHPETNKDRWGSAVQAGIGTHICLTPRFDVTLMTQYMFHLTKEIEAEQDPEGVYTINESSGSALEGHLLATVGLNYKILKLWKR